MNVLFTLASAAVVAGPIAIFFAVLRAVLGRLSAEAPRPKRLQHAVLTFTLGALLFVPGLFIERWIRRQAGLDPHASGADLVPLIYAFFVAAPLEQGLKVAAVGPVWRSRFFEAPIDGVIYAAAAGLGFVSAHDALFLAQSSGASLDLARALLAAPAHLFFAALWGYALGRDAKSTARRGAPQTRLGGRAFNLTWLGVTLFNGVYDYIVFARGGTAMIAAAPILATMAVVGFAAQRELFKSSAVLVSSGPRRRIFTSLAPPSIRAVRAALFRTERPVMLRWIGIGALTTTGVMTTTLAGAVALGHRIGVDFAAVDQGESASMSSLFPLALLGGAALLAFPIAGYLVARASATRSVLEPAISASLAIAGTLVLLGLAAPVAVVFAVAFAPVAFGLACAGAWMGIGR
ncbi:MAG: PrsW family glutamic-type intramembrane protease [Byssovorax sp.]